MGDPSGLYPIFSPEGAKRTEGRWHAKGQEVVYASEHYSTAMLEKLAHFNGVLPSGQHSVQLTIPVGVTYEVVTKDSLPGWIDADTARAFGVQWYEAQRSAVLFVPSFVARMERNLILNWNHADTKRVSVELEEPVVWDERLFREV